MLTSKTWTTTHIRCIIVRVSIYKNSQPVEESIVGKHRPCKETNRSIASCHTQTHTYNTLTSIPWRSLRKVSKKIARPRNWSWFPNTGPRMEAEMRWDVSRQFQTRFCGQQWWQQAEMVNTNIWTRWHKAFWWIEHDTPFSKHFSDQWIFVCFTVM